ncbi:protease modulator HflC [Clostridium grantii]|uniref:Protein HflC n=1 Tax=Clostridium grantii DSM 8605 TaxID=1121316 RepID=A0A1M5UP31_9CLOT|nr:protease modulator HflC [Clostridium grantii]SHH64744.1 membrane protease subunit HflC [Clostridium grantii DSM 8605]
MIINIKKLNTIETGKNIDQKINKSSLVTIIFILLGLIIFSASTFTVEEFNGATVTRFGKVTKLIVNEKTPEIMDSIQDNSKYQNIKVTDKKGLFFKVPFIDSVTKYSSKLLTYDTSAREVTTKDKKKLILDNNAQWQIVNPLLFRISMGNETNAHTRLDDILYSKINEKIGQTEAHVLISDKDYTSNMLDECVTDINKSVSSYGIKVVDIKIKRTDLPSENSENIFNRMKTEREQKAKEYRSEGKEEAQKIRSEADKEAKILEAKAYAEAETIKGEGDAEATHIYNLAYNQDPEFYEFYRTLQTYKKTLSSKTKIIIDSNSPFAKYLFGQ